MNPKQFLVISPFNGSSCGGFTTLAAAKQCAAIYNQEDAKAITEHNAKMKIICDTQGVPFIGFRYWVYTKTEEDY